MLHTAASSSHSLVTHTNPPPALRLPAALLTILQGLVVFNIDGEQWALDLREGSGSVTKGAPAEKPDLTLTISDENFAKLVMGKLNPQQVNRSGAGQGARLAGLFPGSLIGTRAGAHVLCLARTWHVSHAIEGQHGRLCAHC